MRLSTLAVTIVLAAMASGCGLKGPLYLPEKAGPVTTRPGPAAPAAAPAAEPAAGEPGTAEPAGSPPPPSDRTSEKTGG